MGTAPHFEWQDLDDKPGDDKKLGVRFYMRSVKDEKASLAAARPVFVEREYIRILIPDDPHSILDRAVEESDRTRFLPQYTAWKRTLQAAATTQGTPLSAWPRVDRAQVDELSAQGLATVEQLAELPDAKVEDVPTLGMLRTRARDFLSLATRAAPLEHMRTELEAREARIAELEAQLGAAPKEAAPSPPRKRGRPRKSRTPEPEATP